MYEKLLKFYAQLLYITALISVPFFFLIYNELQYNRFSFQIWIGTFIPQLLCFFIIYKKYINVKEFLDYFNNPLSYKKKTVIILLGIILPLIIYTILLMLGTLKLKFNVWSNNILLYFILLSFSALFEEVCFRLIPLYILKENINLKAVIINSFAFCFFHLVNPNLSLIGVINIFLAAILFSFIYLKTQSIYMVTIVHVLWNFTIGCIFGGSISGMEIESLFSQYKIEDNFITGSKFGIEGSIITSIVFILTILWLKPRQILMIIKINSSI